ncbi:uncharacterized protein LOC119103665 [Pollicipes pollicipes]|uniref:uncharacterized protein LOC119103665 n=1 Tax=Pollicipes pollicipes TaxID=41117 RepID=UPI0018855CA0|nr:uncharacterized protein LOC119103665 [Pollicipes pollicipes]
MKIVVLGASGQTGQCVVTQALEQGHSVTAIVRNPDKIKQKHDNLSVVKADIFSAEELTAAFQGHEAVVSALGFSRSDNPVTGYTESMKAVAAAMRAAQLQRLVVMTAFYTDITSAQGRGFLVNWILIPLIKRVLTNMREMEEWLAAEAQDLRWTVVRPGGLSNRALLAQTPLQQADAQFVADPAAATMIPRANVAQFMLAQLPEDTYTRQVVAIAVK